MFPHILEVRLVESKFLLACSHRVPARRMQTAVLLPLLLALTACLVYGQANGKLQIHFMDVEQGDGALLVSPHGETVLFDNGATGHCDKPVSYLLRLGVAKIDYHIASHYHSDHIGCTTEVLRQFPLQNDALDRGGNYDTAVYNKYVAAVGNHRKTAQVGRKIVLDAASDQPVEVEILALNGNGVHTTNENDLSVVAVVRYGGFHAELGGDLSGIKADDYEDIETGVSEKVKQVEVYKVHHHGSRYSSNQTWLGTTKPKVGIISIGVSNTYGHPAQECLTRLHGAGVKTYWTEYGAGAAPQPAWDVVAGDVIVEAEPGGGTFTVRHGTTTDHYSSWETSLAIVSAADYRPGMTSSAWVAVYGSNFTSTSRSWRDDEIIGDQLPTGLDGVRVTINGKPAAVSYISPQQINAQVPTDDTLGPVEVQVTTPQVTTTALAQLREFSPGLFTFDAVYVAAQHANYSPVGKPNLLPGVTTTPAQPLEVIVLYGTGFGRTVPAIPSAQIVHQAAPLANPVTIWIGNRQAEVQWAGRVAAGLDQFNVVVPGDLPEGDAAVIAEIGGFRSKDGPLLTIHRSAVQ